MNSSVSYLQAKWAFRGQVRHCCPHNSSHYYLLLQESSWLQVDFGMSVQSRRRSLTVADFPTALTRQEVNTFIHEVILWIVKGDAETLLSFSPALCKIMPCKTFQHLSIFCHAIISWNCISTVACVQGQYFIKSSKISNDYYTLQGHAKVSNLSK